MNLNPETADHVSKAFLIVFLKRGHFKPQNKKQDLISNYIFFLSQNSPFPSQVFNYIYRLRKEIYIRAANFESSIQEMFCTKRNRKFNNNHDRQF